MFRAHQYYVSHVGEECFLRDDDDIICLAAKLTDDPSGVKILHDFTYENNITPSFCLVKIMTDKIRQFLSEGPKDIKLVVIPGVYAHEFESSFSETHEGKAAIVYNIQVKPRSFGLFAINKIKPNDSVLARLQEFHAKILSQDVPGFQKKLNNTLTSETERNRYRSIIKKCFLAESALRILLDEKTSNDLITDEQWETLMYVFRKEKVIIEYLERCKLDLSTNTNSLIAGNNE